MRLKELNVLDLIAKHKEVKVVELMITIEKIALKNGMEALSLPLTRRSLDYIIACLQEEELIRVYLSKTRPPRKIVVLTLKGREYLKETITKERFLFDKVIADEMKD